MSTFTETVRREASSLGTDLLQLVQDCLYAKKQEDLYNERLDNIATAAKAMLDAGLSDELVTQMLQKHWDLRLSEASDFINWAHSYLNAHGQPKSIGQLNATS